MSEHMQLSDLSEYCTAVQDWLNTRYGVAEGARIWEQVGMQYNKYLEDLPDYGGKQAAHAFSIYGALLIFSMYPLLPDQPDRQKRMIRPDIGQHRIGRNIGSYCLQTL